MDSSKFPPLFGSFPSNPSLRTTPIALMTDTNQDSSSSTIDRPLTVSDRPVTVSDLSDSQIMAINHRFNGRNYLQWSQTVLRYIRGKRKEKYINGAAPQPAADDSNFDTWFAENNQVMTWLCNSMTDEIGENYLLANTAKEIWDSARQTYSSLDNTAALLHLKRQLRDLRQGNLTVTNYYNALKKIWQQQDLYDVHPWETVKDAQLHKKLTDEGRIYDFLLGLNDSFEEIRGRIMGLKPIPPLLEVVNNVQFEESRKLLNQSHSSHSENSALAVNTPKDERIPGKWCSYCKKKGHLKEECWKLHGKPSSSKQYRAPNVNITTAEGSTEDNAYLSFEEVQLFRQMLDKQNKAKSTPSVNLVQSESTCKKGCELALASYYIWVGLLDITYLPQIMKSPVLQTTQDVINYKNGQLLTENYVETGARVNVPFPCDCIDGEFLGYVFEYQIQKRDTYALIANRNYANLTTVSMLESANRYSPENIPETGTLNVTVNCSCGDSKVSKEYGLFVTYPLRVEDSLDSIANMTGLPQELLQRYNPGVDFNKGSGLVYIPGKDQNGVFAPLPRSTKGLNGGAVAGLSAGVVAGFLLLAACLYFVYYHRKEKKKLLSEELVVYSAQTGNDSNGPPPAASIIVEKSVEFSYEELARATNNFSMANKIGEGGFGAVYYAELRGEKTAVKKMKSQDTKVFLSELKVLARVHHLNLVCLIGYCVKKHFLFLVCEYIDNGNLREHLDPGREPLPWSMRVRIALDSARGLEYIHEHTVPAYIHRDIKPANILIDRDFHAKVADFGLTKLIEVGSSSYLSEHLAGTFGYIPLRNDGSVKTDVYAFGVVLYELISAKEAVLSVSEAGSEAKTLLTLFEEALQQPDPEEHLLKLVDPRLEGEFTFDSIYKMVELAKACTQEQPDRRPSMRSVVVSLMTLLSSME